MLSLFEDRDRLAHDVVFPHQGIRLGDEAGMRADVTHEDEHRAGPGMISKHTQHAPGSIGYEGQRICTGCVMIKSQFPEAGTDQLYVEILFRGEVVEEQSGTHLSGSRDGACRCPLVSVIVVRGKRRIQDATSRCVTLVFTGSHRKRSFH